MAQLTQPKGMVSKETNKEAIARVFGLKKRQVGYLSTSTAVDSYTILYDEATQTCWDRGTATGTPISWTISGDILTLVTNTGTFDIVKKSLVFSDILSQNTGSTLVGYRYSNVYDVLSRMTSYYDYGVSQPALGRDQPTNQIIFDAQTPIDLKHRGGLQLNKQCYGIRENATTLSVRSGTNTGSGFVPQVAGSDSIVTLASAGALDAVTIFADNYIGPYLASETLDVTNYTASTFTVADPSVLSAAKIGAFVITRHSSPFVGLIKSISGTTVTVDEWCIYGTTTVGTPANGTGLYLNPVKKGWAINANILLDTNTKATACALTEFGLQNNGLADPSFATGVDSVVLPGTYGGGDGFRSRGTTVDSRWTNAFHAYGGIATNFRSTTGQGPCLIASFYEESNSAVGFLFRGNNTSRSISWQDTAGNEQTALAPYGYQIRGGKGLSTATSGTAVSAGGKVIVPNSSAFSLVLPDATNFTAGREISFILTGTSSITITSAQSGGTVNGNASQIITPTTTFTEATATYAGSGLWYFTR